MPPELPNAARATAQHCCLPYVPQAVVSRASGVVPASYSIPDAPCRPRVTPCPTPNAVSHPKPEAGSATVRNLRFNCTVWCSLTNRIVLLACRTRLCLVPATLHQLTQQAQVVELAPGGRPAHERMLPSIAVGPQRGGRCMLHPPCRNRHQRGAATAERARCCVQGGHPLRVTPQRGGSCRQLPAMHGCCPGHQGGCGALRGGCVQGAACAGPCAMGAALAGRAAE